MRSERGFTLLEMSIVLILIGLIVGSITIGRQVLRNAQIQGIVSDVNKYKNAAKLFRDKYNFLPGDLPNAATYWGADTGCPAGNTASNATRVSTCNGNGNGRIDTSALEYTHPASMGTDGYLEALRVWQHLANGRFIDGQYSGVPYDTTSLKAGYNVPKSSASGDSSFIFFYSYPIGGSIGSAATPDGSIVSDLYPANYGHFIEYGAISSSSLINGLSFPALTPTEAKNIDDKVDDGMPTSGNILSFSNNSNSPNCVNELATPIYKVTSNNIYCALIFITGF